MKMDYARRSTVAARRPRRRRGRCAQEVRDERRRTNRELRDRRIGETAAPVVSAADGGGIHFTARSNRNKTDDLARGRLKWRRAAHQPMSVDVRDGKRLLNIAAVDIVNQGFVAVSCC